MHKLQCLNISKNFLQGCFKGSLQFLSEHSYWRDGFKDQLEVAYRDSLFTNVFRQNQKYDFSADVLDGVVDT